MLVKLQKGLGEAGATPRTGRYQELQCAVLDLAVERHQ